MSTRPGRPRLAARSVTTAVAAAAAAGLALCGAGAAGAPPQGGRPVVNVRIADDSSITLRSALRPGLVHFRVSGAGDHSLQLVQPRNGADRRTLVSDVNTLTHTGIPTDLERDFRLVGGSDVGSDLWLRLGKGTYFAVDTGASTLKYRNIDVLTVSGSRVDSAAPALSGTVTAIGDMDWAGRPASIGHAGNLRFDNHSSDTHFVVLAKLKAGVTIGELKKALRDPNADPSAYLTHDEAYNGVVSPGGSETTSYALPTGRYALMCFWDDEDGRTHASMGMVREITLR